MQSEQTIGTVTVLRDAYAILSAELVLYTVEERDESYKALFLEVYAGTETEEGISGGGMFRLDQIPVKNVHSLAELGGKRMHFIGGETSALDDDTLGSMPPDACETSLWYFGYEDYELWIYDEMKVDFTHLGDNKFEVKVECAISNYVDDKVGEGHAAFTVQGREERG